MNIAITGATGVLGSLLNKKLSETGIHTISLFEGDITHQAEVENWLSTIEPNYLFHFAALVPIDAVSKDPFRAFEVNVGGTINLLSALKKQGKKPWIFYASTSHVYKSSEAPIAETWQEQPINFYGATKLNAEKACEAFAASNDYQLCIGRIFSFYHDTQKGSFLYPSIVKRLQTEDLTKPFKLRGARSVRDILNAENIVELILKLKEKKYSGKVNVASGKGITIEEFVRQVSQQPIQIEAEDTDFNSLVADITKLNSIIYND